jgi:hypothetical protein
MKGPVLPSLIGALVLIGVAVVAHADSGVFVNWPLVPGPSGYLGPFMPVSRPAAGPQQPIQRPVYQAPVSVQYHAYVHASVRPGEPDETGLIGPTAKFERDADGKLLPTHMSR